MNKKSDAKEEMVKTALRLFRSRGFAGVGVAELLEQSGFPRGSLYFHFPGGKEEIGVAAMQRQTQQDCENMLAAKAICDSAEEFVAKVYQVIGDRVERSAFRAGCVVGAITQEAAADASLLQEAAARCFAEMLQVMEEVLAHFGLPPEKAAQGASAMLTGLQGATLQARAFKRIDPFEHSAQALIAYLETLRR
jgi:TetR/AcrR family transcriptional repressor of lmrAB and yxaGH operons